MMLAKTRWGWSVVLVVALALAYLLGAYTLHPEATVAAPRNPTHVVRAMIARDIAHGGSIEWAGDSLSYGYYATTLAQSYRALVESHYGAADLEVPHTGPGQTAQAISYDFANGLTSAAPASLIVVELGTNDFGQGHSWQTFASDYGNVVWSIHQEQPHAPLLCLGIWDYGGSVNAAGSYGDQYDAEIKQLCANQGGLYLSLEAYFWDSGPAARSTWLGSSDSFHPNDVGHARIAGGILCAEAGNCTG